MKTSTYRRTGGLVIVALLAALMALPLTATAATHVIELPQTIVFGVEGQEVDLGTFPTPADLVGQICTVTATGNNNRSVHVGNNLRVSSANSVMLFGVEDSRNKTTVAADLLTLNAQITFTLVLGSDPVYSAELDILLDCEPPPTTTVPEETTTTVPEETTTTEPEVSDTTVTTTTQPEETTTTQPEEPATTTTAAPEVQAETTTTVGTGGETDDTLPFTGIESDQLALMALLAVAAGGGLVLTTRRSSEASR